MIKKMLLGLVFMTPAFAAPLVEAEGGSVDLQATASRSISKIDREASMDPQGAMLLADLLQKELGTPEEELKWSTDRNIGWGRIAAMAYIEATTGRTFASINNEGALQDIWAYVESAGMSSEKMARWIAGFQKRAERERNSRIFDGLRESRRVFPIPDIGSGFGLLQEGLDFRNIDSSRPNKVHDFPGEPAEGVK